MFSQRILFKGSGTLRAQGLGLQGWACGSDARRLTDSFSCTDSITAFRAHTERNQRVWNASLHDRGLRLRLPQDPARS